MTKRRELVPWAPHEDALICRLRGKGRDKDEIAAALSRRTPTAVKGRLAHLIRVGRIASHRVVWTLEEDALIRDLRAARTSATGIAQRLENRTVDAVKKRIEHLRRDGRLGRVAGHARSVPPQPWTDREERLLIRMRSQDATLDRIASRLPKRTRGAVARHVQQLLDAEELEPSLHAPKSRLPWSAEEDELVAAMRAADKTVLEIAAALHRSVASVNGRIARRVQAGELEVLRVLAPRKPVPLRKR